MHFLPFTLPKILLGCSKENDNSGDSQVQQTIFGLLGVKSLDVLGSRKRLFRVSPRLENSFCEICRQKMSLGQGQENDFSGRKMAPSKHFWPSFQLKIQIQRGFKIVNLGVRITLRSHFLCLVKMKNDLGPDEKVLFQGFRRLCKFDSCF
jgi:hypothetical protein